MKPIPEDDLRHVLSNTEYLWSDIKNSTFFFTGGTGFFGKWLVSSFLFINNELKLNNKLIILTRNSSKFIEQNPWFNNYPELSFIVGDVRDFDIPEHSIDYIINAATEASVDLNLNEPLLMYDTIVTGTRNILELARIKSVKGILHTSSGAVYGNQPSHLENVDEAFGGSPDIYNNGAAYGEGKRVAEMLAAIYYRKHNVPSKIARCYAFAGPYLALNGSFAFGNFILDALSNQDIIISGDGSAYRSYLYASDLVIWLFTILFKGDICRPYNVGSDEGVTIAQLAKLIATCVESNNSVKILGKRVEGSGIQRYVPNIARAKNELSLNVRVSLIECINKTIEFYRGC